MQVYIYVRIRSEAILGENETSKSICIRWLQGNNNTLIQDPCAVLFRF